MKRTTISLLVAGLFITAPNALAQLKFKGSVTGEVLGGNVNSRNGFRFEEYRDLSDGATLGADIKGESDRYHIELFGENVGRDDQFIEFKGGKYGVFKYSLYNNDIIHNLTFNAISPFSGIGTSNLTFPGALGATASTNTATWTPFDYSIKHENYGGTFELQASADFPFYFRGTANQKKTQGIRPIGETGGAQGGPVIELPAPVDYTTTDVSAEAGYATRSRQFSVNLSHSKFQDHLDFLRWRNPNITGLASTTFTETTTLATDSDLWKVAANGMFKQLPMGSTLALRGSYSKLTNSLPVQTSFTVVAAGVGTTRQANPSSTVYNGDIVNKTASASLTSQLARTLDSRLYWNWLKKENDSTRIVFTPTGGNTCDINLVTGIALTTCTTEAFHYEKNNLGIDLGFRVNPRNKVSGGWDYLDTTRERLDFDDTKEHKVYVGWKNSSYELLSTRIKYQRLQRRSNFRLGGINPAANANNFFNFYFKRFDLVDNDQDLVKLGLDSTPLPFLDLGAEVILKHNDFKGVALGRTGDHREELYLTASFGDPKRFRLTAFFDYEQTYYDSTHWQGTPTAATFPAPSGGPPSTNFLWTGNVKDKNYLVGLAADWPYSERLKFNGSLIWQETDGTADFASNGVNVTLFPITAYDSFRKTALNLKGVYAVDKNVELTLGAAYERYRVSDVSIDGYNHTLLVGATQHYLTGAYAFPDYNAAIAYMSLKYKFR